MPGFKSLPSHWDRTDDALPSVSRLICLGGKVRILALPELLKNPDSDFLGSRAASFPKLAPEPNKFLLLSFVHGNPPSRIQNIVGTFLQDGGLAGTGRRSLACAFYRANINP
jgi:hypothetical protein